MRIAALALVLVVCAGAFADEAAQFDFANGLFARGFYGEAADEYQKYLDAYPDGPNRLTAHYRLGESRYASKKYEEAVAALDAVLSSQGADLELRLKASLRKGVALFQLQQHKDALGPLKAASGGDAPAAVRSEAYYYLGKVAYATKDYPAAAAAYKALLELEAAPLQPYGQYQLGHVYLAQGDFESAASEFTALAAREGADDSIRMEARYRAAEAYDKLGWYDAAVKAYENLKTEFAGSDYARKASYGYAWSLYHGGKFGEALNAAEEYRKEFPEGADDPGIRYLQGNCLQQQRRFDEAIAAYGGLIENYPDTDFAARGMNKQAWAFHLSGKPGKAKEVIYAFLDRFQEHPLRGDAQFLLASIANEGGAFEEAYAAYDQVVDNFSNSEFAPEALYKSAECLVALNRPGDAAPRFERFAETYPDHELAREALLRAGDAQFQAGDFASAAARFDSALSGEIGAELKEALLYRRAIALHNASDFTKSAEAFKRLVMESPETTHKAEAYLRIGDHALREKQEALEAMEAFEKAYAQDPKGPFAGQALRGLALARFEAKDLDGAAEGFLKVMQEFPDLALNEDTYVWSGEHFLAQERWEEGSRVFERMLATATDYPNPERIHFTLGEAYAKSGQAEKAMTSFRTVIESAPQSTLSLDARYHLAQLLEAAGQREEAIPLYVAAADANIGDTAARSRFRLAEIWESDEDFGRAAREFMRVAILYFHEELSPESLLRAGQCFEKAEDGEQARKAYREIVDDYPDSGQATAAQERLTALEASG